MYKAISLTFCCLALAGCDQLGLETPAQVAAVKEAEGRAIGSACRHSGRALEDCYLLNKKASKAAIFAGWRDMDAYMRENNLEIVVPTESAAKAKPADKAAEEKADKPQDAEAKPVAAPSSNSSGANGMNVPPRPSGGGKMV